MSNDVLDYESVISSVLAHLPDALVVPNLGAATAALMSAGPRHTDMYMWGGMGLTHSVGLGVALARPDRRVVVLDGDGSLIMGMAGMATIGAESPHNLMHVVLDNQAWGNTGGQPTHSAGVLCLSDVARACGYDLVVDVQDAPHLKDALDRALDASGPAMIVVRLPFDDPKPAPREPEPIAIKHNFMRACSNGAEETASRAT